jgi:alpha-aminoadipic semialdehyde synthase
MSFKLGIRREDKNKWEKRVPITPEHVKELKEKHNIDTLIQPSQIRAFTDKEYQQVGATVVEDVSSSNAVFAIKEIPNNFFSQGKTYLFFSHTIKGQKKNMPMLKKMIELGCTLIDYEKIIDNQGRRLVFFGRYAGIVGMIDILWAFGQRVKWRGIDTSLSQIKQTINYKNLDEAKEHIESIGNKIREKGIPDFLTPIVVGFVGYGNVSKGAQEILDLLPVDEIRPKQLEAIHENFSDKIIYKVVFKEEDLVEPIHTEKSFNLQDYYNNPHLYHSVFQQYIHRLSILMNCIYWSEKYPRLITKYFLEKNYTRQMKLQVVGDISVDINGAIEFTEKTTTPWNPVFVYNPIRRDIVDGYNGSGVVVMAIDNLPCELPFESSKAFSDSLIRFIPPIVKADYSTDFKNLALPSEIKKAVILYKGKLTPEYEYINSFL